MKIAFYEVEEWEKPYIKEQLKEHEVIFYDYQLRVENCCDVTDIDAVSIFIHSKIPKEVMDRLPNLKLIATRSTGFDHIDLEEAKNRNIIVSNVPTYGENTVAEHTFALILNLARNVHKSYIRTSQNNFSIDGLEGFDLKGKTLGVIGTGHIGMHVIKIAKGFGMNVIAFDPQKHKFISEILGFKYVTFDKLLEKSDIISLHAPYNEHTHHLINKENINNIKKGAILINTSRGGLIDTEALINALDQGILRGAGLDVIEGEELIKEEKELLHDPSNTEKLQTILRDHFIFKKENVIFTPHNAFNSIEAKHRILDTTLENIFAYLDNKPKNIVSKD